MPSADLANTLLTTAVETWGWSWTSKRASTPYGLVSRSAVDSPELAKPPEERKVGGSTPPLTTRSEQAIWLLTCGHVTVCRALPPPPHSPPRRSPASALHCRPRPGRPCPSSPLLAARGRGRPARNGGPPPAHGKRGRPPGAGSPRPVGPPPGRARHLPPPRRGQSRRFPAEAV